jgi:hypothetical protein
MVPDFSGQRVGLILKFRNEKGFFDIEMTRYLMCNIRKLMKGMGSISGTCVDVNQITHLSARADFGESIPKKSGSNVSHISPIHADIFGTSACLCKYMPSYSLEIRVSQN